MFYNKTLNVAVVSVGYTDEYGIWHEGATAFGDAIECDVQPMTKELAFKIFGVDINVKYRIFTDTVFEVGTIIQYTGKLYRVSNVLQWDDYCDFIVSDYGI